MYKMIFIYRLLHRLHTNCFKLHVKKNPLSILWKYFFDVCQFSWFEKTYLELWFHNFVVSLNGKKQKYGNFVFRRTKIWLFIQFYTYLLLLLIGQKLHQVKLWCKYWRVAFICFHGFIKKILTDIRLQIFLKVALNTITLMV